MNLQDKNIEIQRAINVGAPLKLALLVGYHEPMKATGLSGERLEIASGKEKVCRDEEEGELEETKAVHSTSSSSSVSAILDIMPTRLVESMVNHATIPDLWFVSLHQKVYFPLHWWSDSILRHVTAAPLSIPCKTITTTMTIKSSNLVAPPGASIRVVDVGKLTGELGDEDASKLTPDLWRYASITQLHSLRLLRESYETEYERHVHWFLSLECFEDVRLFPMCYAVEKELRYAIYNNGAFSLSAYEQRVEIALGVHQSIPRHLSAPNLTVPQLPTVCQKRIAVDDGNPASLKAPRNDDGTRGCDRSKTPSFHEDPVAAIGLPACLICVGPHNAYSHPPDKTTFEDGSALFTGPGGRGSRNLRTLRPFRGGRQWICIEYNLGRGCLRDHRGQERLHICSLCGGNHAALSRDVGCRRTRDGVLVS